MNPDPREEGCLGPLRARGPLLEHVQADAERPPHHRAPRALLGATQRLDAAAVRLADSGRNRVLSLLVGHVYKVHAEADKLPA